MTERVLFVDDETNVLEAIQRTLRKQIDLQTASSGAEGLRVLTDMGPFALVISDMRMPAMNGAQFLAKVREQAPDTVRMILSGQADLQATIDAVNEGHIYRFLSKPCPSEQLLFAVADGLKQYRLLTAEKVLLEKTLSGSVKMLTELLAMVSPTASSRAGRLQGYAQQLRKTLALPERWEWDLAGFVSQIGCVALPKELLLKVEAGQPITDEESKLFRSHPEVAGKLLASIPRLEDVAAIVAAQFGELSFAGNPDDLAQWDVRSAGQLLLRAAVDFDRLIVERKTPEDVARIMAASKLALPAALITAIRTISVACPALVLRAVRLRDMVAGMVLDEDLLSLKGIRLVPAGHEVTDSLIVRLTSIASGVGVKQPFRVRVSSGVLPP